MKMLHLAHINSYYLSNTLHGELVRKVRDENPGIDQIIYVPLMKSDNVPYVPEHSEHGIRLVFSKCFDTLSRYIWPVKIAKVYRDFRKKIATNEINVTHSHSLISNGMVSYMIFKKKKIPYIITVRNTDINIFLKKSRMFRKLGETILKNASSVMVLSPAYRDQQLKKYISPKVFQEIFHKIHVIPNGVNDFWIDNRYQSHKDIDGTAEILFVGKLRPNKNTYGLIEACNILASKGVPVRLTIVGDGSLKDELLGKQYGFEVNYLGFIGSKEELLKVYRSCHIMAVPSFLESFGLVYVEAMTQGLPVIYTKGQGFDGNFDEGHVGFSTRADDYQEMAGKIKDIIDNYSFMAANAYIESARFSWSVTSNKLANLYNNAIIK